jgi:hypothetical protein
LVTPPISLFNFGAYLGVDMKEIVLTQGRVALVDDCDFERFSEFKWHAQKSANTFYARRMSPAINSKRHMIKMHHEIIGCPPKGFMTDHADGNGLNNQRENLRFVTHRQNCQNKKNIETSSQYPGVGWRTQRNKWRARIKINGKEKFLDHFISEFEAL